MNPQSVPSCGPLTSSAIGMATSAGINHFPEFTLENVAPVSHIQSLIGVTNNGGYGFISSIGMAQLDNSESLTRVSIAVSKWPPEDTARLFTSFDVWTETPNDTGIWLFRPVPEPASLLLCGLAIACFYFVCHRAKP